MKCYCLLRIIILAILLTGCFSLPKQPVEQAKVSYEEAVLPFIIEQLNNTASTFFYDTNKANIILKNFGIPVSENEEPSKNAILGKEERGGVCDDYALHFIDNYKGQGEVLFLSVGNEKTEMVKRLKPFEKSDIILHNSENINSFIEYIYQRALNYHDKNKEVAYCHWLSEGLYSFYTKKINETIYWSENGFFETTLINFKKEHIINFQNLQENIYNYIYQYNINNRSNHWYYNYKQGEYLIANFDFYTNDKGEIFIIEKTSIPTPEFHAGKTIKDFSCHSWVRILWNGMVIDVDPTWYDNGVPHEEVIEVVK